MATRLFARYITHKADSTAKLMEVIIRQKPRLSMFKFPANDMFRAAIARGSVDLYECYIEEAIEPHLQGKTEDKQTDCYLELFNTAEDLTLELFSQYQRCVKGTDFNGAFARYEKNENVALIHQEDFQIMDDVVENFNAIIGRRDILKDLNKRMGF